MSDLLINSLSKLLISQPALYARQSAAGAYHPVTDPTGTEYLPWRRSALREHLAGTATYGHYAVEGNQSKFFAFDIDLKTKAKIFTVPDLTQAPDNSREMEAWLDKFSLAYDANPRKMWAEFAPNDQARLWFEWQMRTMAEIFKYAIESTLGIPTLSSYSGSKGMHVYGFPSPGEKLPAKDLRAAGRAVIDSMGHYWQAKNDSGIFWFNSQDPCLGLFDIELFPKQDQVDEGGMGNLMRMELGIHQKSRKPGFFIDHAQDVMRLTAHDDPETLLKGILG